MQTLRRFYRECLVQEIVRRRGFGDDNVIDRSPLVLRLWRWLVFRTTAKGQQQTDK